MDTSFMTDAAGLGTAVSTAHSGDAGTIAFAAAQGAASFVPGGSALVSTFGSLIKTIGGHPGPGKIYKPDCDAANGVRGVKATWDTKYWGMGGHCRFEGSDAWNVALAVMKGKGDPRVCKTLIPTESGICPVVCSKASSGPKVGPACSMPNAAGKLSGKNKTNSCLTQGGNCAVTKADNGSYNPTVHNPAPSLDDPAHIAAVLNQGGSVGDLSHDQIYDLLSQPNNLLNAVGRKAAQAGGLGLSSVFGSGTNNLLVYVIIGGVAVISLIAAIKR